MLCRSRVGTLGDASAARGLRPLDRDHRAEGRSARRLLAGRVHHRRVAHLELGGLARRRLADRLTAAALLDGIATVPGCFASIFDRAL